MAVPLIGPGIVGVNACPCRAVRGCPLVFCSPAPHATSTLLGQPRIGPARAVAYTKIDAQQWTRIRVGVDSRPGSPSSLHAYSLCMQGKGTGRPRRITELFALAGAPTGRNTLTTVIGGFAVQLFLLVSGVVVARLLGVENRGHLALYWVIALIVTFLGTTGLPSSVTYWIARRPRE